MLLKKDHRVTRLSFTYYCHCFGQRTSNGSLLLCRGGGASHNAPWPLLGFVVLLRLGFCLFVCLLFRVLYSLVELLLSHTSPQGSRGGSGSRGQTSGSCVSPPGPDEAMPPSPPETGRKCPHLQTPGRADKVDTLLLAAGLDGHVTD